MINNSSQDMSKNELQNLDLKQLIQALCAEKWIIIACNLVFIFLAIFVLRSQPVEYQSSLFLQAQLIDSKKKLDTWLKVVDLNEEFSVNKFRFALVSDPSLLASVAEKFSPNEQKIITQIKNNLMLSEVGYSNPRGGRTGILELSLRDRDPKLVAAVLNDLAEKLVEKNAQQRTEKLAAKLKLLQQYLVEMDKNLSALEDQQSTQQNNKKLRRDLKMEQENYANALKEVHELKVLSLSAPDSLQILTYAPIPQAPLGSSKWYKIVALLILGFGLSILLALVKRSFAADKTWAILNYAPEAEKYNCDAV